MTPLLQRATAAAFISFLCVTLLAPPGAAFQQSASLSVLHVAEGVPQAQIVDVYVGTMRILEDLGPGELRAVRITRGEYVVQVFPADQDPRQNQPLAVIDGLRLMQDSNVTVVLHRAADGALTATDFTNNLLRNPRGQGRVTIRHVAHAPALDIQIGETRQVRNVTNSDEVTIRGLRGDQFTEIRQSDTPVTLVPARRIPISRPISTVLYVWGSAPDGLRVAVQPIAVGKG